MNNKTTNILLGILAAVMLVGLGVYLQKGNQSSKGQSLGEVNDLGTSDFRCATSEVGSIQSASDANSSTTAYQIVAANTARQYLTMEPEPEGNTVRFVLASTTPTSTDPENPSLDIWNTGIEFGTTSNSNNRFVIGPDNLYKGDIWGLATSATTTSMQTTTVRVCER